MSYKKEKIELEIPVKFTKLECDSCGSRFVILYIMEFESEDGSTIIDYVVGGTSYYCPHCGKDHRKEEYSWMKPNPYDDDQKNE